MWSSYSVGLLFYYFTTNTSMFVHKYSDLS